MGGVTLQPLPPLCPEQRPQQPARRRFFQAKGSELSYPTVPGISPPRALSTSTRDVLPPPPPHPQMLQNRALHPSSAPAGPRLSPCG